MREKWKSKKRRSSILCVKKAESPYGEDSHENVSPTDPQKPLLKV
jgi:hypothetical protein